MLLLDKTRISWKLKEKSRKGSKWRRRFENMLILNSDAELLIGRT